MKASELFALYNVRQIRTSLWQYVMISLSVFVAVAVCMAVPQAIVSSRQYIEDTARTMVGADVKVTGTFPSRAFTATLDGLRAGNVSRVEERVTSTASIKSGSNYRVVVMVGGVAELAADEAVPSEGLARKTGLKAGDFVEVSGRRYRVASIDHVLSGVDRTAETMGYLKVKDLQVSLPTSRIYLLTTSRPAQVRDALKVAEPDFRYTTVEDQKESMRDQLTANALALNALSTMCLLLTVLAIFACVIMIVRQRLTDTAIMTMLAVERATVRRAFVMELQSMLLLPVAVGGLASRWLARFVLHGQGVPLKASWGGVAAGCVLCIASYSLLVLAVSRAVGAVDGLDVLKGGGGGTRLRLAPAILLSLAVTLATLFGYAVLGVGNSGAFAMSLGVMLLLLAFFAVTRTLLWVLTSYRPAGRFGNYTVNRLRHGAASSALTVVSMSLLLWFVLFGFAFSQVVASSFTSRLERSISYDYLLTGKNPAAIGQALASAPDVAGSTPLYCTPGMARLTEDRTRTVVVAGVAVGRYDRRFELAEGKDVMALAPQEVVASQAFMSQNNLKLGDSFPVNNGDAKPEQVTIAGVYVSGGINDDYLLRRLTAPTDSSKVIYLVQSSGDDFLKSLQDVTVVNVAAIGEGLNTVLARYLDLFKYMCFFCILSALVFNVNLIQLKYVDRRELVVVRAMGIPQRFLAWSAVARMSLEAVLSGLLAVVLFVVVARTAIQVMLPGRLTATLPWRPILGSTGLFIGFLFALYGLAELVFVRRASSNYEVLREQV